MVLKIPVYPCTAWCLKTRRMPKKINMEWDDCVEFDYGILGYKWRRTYGVKVEVWKNNQMPHVSNHYAFMKGLWGR